MKARYLFKGKRIDNGEWVIGTRNIYGDGVFISEIELKNNNGRNWMVISKEVIPETVGQCTGIKSRINSYKTGNPQGFLFEHDTVRTSKCNSGVIVWHNKEWKIQRYNSTLHKMSQHVPAVTSLTDFRYAEITGNIHDNKEV